MKRTLRAEVELLKLGMYRFPALWSQNALIDCSGFPESTEDLEFPAVVSQLVIFRKFETVRILRMMSVSSFRISFRYSGASKAPKSSES